VTLLRRIPVTVVVALALVFVGVNRIAPAARSLYAAKKAPTVASVVPIDLKDKFVSKDPGKKLSYFGIEFEVPWTDLDETQTKLYPKEKSEKTKVDLRFRSGLRIVVSVRPPREWVNELQTEIPAAMRVSPQDLESVFGREAMKSDYSFTQALYEFTPDNMNPWTASRDGNNREELLLIIKSLALSKAAETGIFNVRNQGYAGFQEGNPRVRQDEIVVDLFSGDGSVRMIFFQGDYRNYTGVTQPDINRIVQSLHKSNEEESRIQSVARR
jgi:hypothetical protein